MTNPYRIATERNESEGQSDGFFARNCDILLIWLAGVGRVVQAVVHRECGPEATLAVLITIYAPVLMREDLKAFWSRVRGHRR